VGADPSTTQLVARAPPREFVRISDFASSIIFGECQLMAWLIMRESPVSPSVDKDFRVCHPRLARRNYAAVTLNHQK
jgi:hypothetical protein